LVEDKWVTCAEGFNRLSPRGVLGEMRSRRLAFEFLLEVS
jgi:hypothetical protein